MKGGGCYIWHRDNGQGLGSEPTHLIPITHDVEHHDHSPDNVKFPDGSQHSSPALGMLSVIHIMLVLVLNKDANMQFTINSFRQLFPDKILSPTVQAIARQVRTGYRQMNE